MKTFLTATALVFLSAAFTSCNIYRVSPCDSIDGNGKIKNLKGICLAKTP